MSSVASKHFYGANPGKYSSFSQQPYRVGLPRDAFIPIISWEPQRQPSSFLVCIRSCLSTWTLDTQTSIPTWQETCRRTTGENVPFQPRRDYYNGQSPLSSEEIGTDRVGDYVAPPVPVMLSRSERPLQLVMNFGDLTLEDAPQLQAGGSGRSHSSRSASNAVIYNAPAAP